MELCTRCDRLFSVKEDEGDYYKDKPYCKNCWYLVVPEEEVA